MSSSLVALLIFVIIEMGKKRKQKEYFEEKNYSELLEINEENKKKIKQLNQCIEVLELSLMNSKKNIEEFIKNEKNDMNIAFVSQLKDHEIIISTWKIKPLDSEVNRKLSIKNRVYVNGKNMEPISINGSTPFSNMVDCLIENDEIVYLKHIDIGDRFCKRNNGNKRRGIGSILIKELEDLSKGYGAKKIVVETSTVDYSIEPKNNVENFYKRTGFTVVKELTANNDGKVEKYL